MNGQARLSKSSGDLVVKSARLTSQFISSPGTRDSLRHCSLQQCLLIVDVVIPAAGKNSTIKSTDRS